MNDFLSKLSSYNLFNYLLPGILFAVLAKQITHYSFIQNEIVIGVFLYYFIGMVISRVGSLVIEPTLKWLSFVRFAPYKDFIKASEKDPKIEVLSEANNTYRTLSALFIILLFLKLYEKLEDKCAFLRGRGGILLIFLLFIMFLFAYRKQTRYITDRIDTSGHRPTP